MTNLERWIYGIPMPEIATFELLKEEVCKNAEDDYVFFPFLIGHVKRYLNVKVITEDVRNCVFELLYELIIEDKVEVVFVTKTELKAADWKSKDDVKRIIQDINNQWLALGEKEPEMNEIIWLMAKQSH